MSLHLTDGHLLQTLKQFSLLRILNDDPANHSVAVLGTLPISSPLEGTDISLAPAILRIERLPIAEDFIRNIAGVLQDGKLIESNDIYSWLFAWFEKHETAPDAKISIICPATETHIRKYSKQAVFMVHETPEIYERIVKPYIAAFPPSRTQWVEDILSGASEADKVLYRHDSPTDGFLILPDMKWDLTNTSTLYLVALVLDRRIRSLRDLRKSHVPMLKNIMEQASHAVKTRWGLEKASLRFYVHYQPSYYHFHVHIVNASYSGLAGMNVGQAHLLDDLVNLIELSDADGHTILERMTFTYGLGEQHRLFEEIKRAQSETE